MSGAGLVALAELAARTKRDLDAFSFAREALRAGGDDAYARVRARAVLSRLIPGYHVPLMNDARRNLAWDRTLRRAIRPGMIAYEIGTGVGMLAMMAARAGAAHVFTSENHPVVAELAREVIALNGLSDRVTVLGDGSQAVTLAERADLLFCDVFGDSLINFRPLEAIADAKARLLKPGAAIVPRSVSLNVALASWSEYRRCAWIDSAAGFDLRPMRDYANAVHKLRVEDRDVTLLSAAAEIVRIDLLDHFTTTDLAADVVCTVDRVGELNGVARWIRLGLDDETSLEARPGAEDRFFSAARFIAAETPEPLAIGDWRRIRLRQAGAQLHTWIETPR